MPYMQYGLDDRQIQQLEDKLGQGVRDAETTINTVIHGRGAKEIMQNIIGFMPRSKRQKKHAKDSQPFAAKEHNLGVMIYEKKEFEYLVFPELGIGLRNKDAQEFMQRGLQEASDDIFRWILEALTEKLGGL